MTEKHRDEAELSDTSLDGSSESESNDLLLAKGEVEICLRKMREQTVTLLGITDQDRSQGVRVLAALPREGNNIILKKLLPQKGRPGVFKAEERIILPGSPLYPLLHSLTSFGRDFRKLLNNKVGWRKSLTAVRRKEKQESAGLEASA